MLSKMYVEGSLKNQGDGFVFAIKNKIESGSMSGVANLSVDGAERSLEGATIQIGEKKRLVSEISWSSSLYVPYGATLTIYVLGSLEPGEHTLNMQFNIPELGRVSFPVIDTLA
jgi:hypothetical protein